MKIAALCVLSLGLSLAVLGDAARHRGYGDHIQSLGESTHEDHHIPHNAIKAHQVRHHHHRNNNNNHRNNNNNNNNNQQQVLHREHEVLAAAIPNLPYFGHDHQKPNDEDNIEQGLDDTKENKEAERQKKIVQEHRKQKDPGPNKTPSSHKKKKMVVAYWTDWTSAAMPPEAIPFDKVTHVNYAFSILTSDFRPVFETDNLLTRVVKAAHAKNVKVLMSIGGWTGSQYFSPLSASVQGRKTFIDGAVKMVKDFDLDGIDIDWEYPGRQGSACNVFDEQNDAKNFLTLLNELRAALDGLPKGSSLQISLATRIVPFDGPDGQLQDVSAFSKVVNHINIMAYDINGSWGTVTGANAPLTGPGSLTYKGGAQAWIDAGFPARQINMGVPFYGRSLITKTDMTSVASISVPFYKKVPPGDNNDELWTDPCENSAAYSGVWKFRNLREQGLLDVNGNAEAPWVRKFDEDSQTPWLFNPETKQFISYDDRESLRLKVEYAKKTDMGGVMLWALNQDSSDFELLDVLQGVRQ